MCAKNAVKQSLDAIDGYADITTAQFQHNTMSQLQNAGLNVVPSGIEAALADDGYTRTDKPYRHYG